jgi:hypothetical protein
MPPLQGAALSRSAAPSLMSPDTGGATTRDACMLPQDWEGEEPFAANGLPPTASICPARSTSATAYNTAASPAVGGISAGGS